MPKKALYMNYHYQKNGEKELVSLLGCIDSLYYFVNRQKFKGLNISDVFFEDISLLMVQNPDGSIHDINNNFMKDMSQVFELKVYKTKGTEAVKLLEKFLNRGKMVITATIMRLLPFTIHYDENYNPKTFNGKSYHRFLIIWHDKDYYYYIETPPVINHKYYIPYERNPQIGKIEKEKLNNIFKYYAEFSITYVKRPKLKKEIRKVPIFLKKIIDNYYKPSQFENEKKVYSGRLFITRFIEICGEGKIKLNDSTFGGELCGRLEWKLGVEKERFKVLLDLLNNHYRNHHLGAELIASGEETLKVYSILRDVMMKEYYKENYSFAKLEKYFVQALNANDRFIRLLDNILQK